MANVHEVIVITGVTRGIGRGMAEFYLSQGHTVIGCGRGKEEIALLQEKYKDCNCNVDFSVVDVSVEDEVKDWSRRIVEKFGAPTFLINNAGIITENNFFWKVSGEEFDRVIDVNIKGCANVLRHFIPHMIEAKKGIIVNLSAGAGVSARRLASPYCSSKFGIEGMSRTIAQELPAPLACCTFHPGRVFTFMYKIYLEGRENRVAENECSVEKWVQVGCPLILGLTRENNGEYIIVPPVGQQH